MRETQLTVSEHYGRGSLVETLAAALDATEAGSRPLSITDLAPLDQFHTRGLAATMELANAAQIAPSMSVIDVGSGLGGPSRYLAATFDCRVHGIDLNPAFVEAATYLAERVGLASRVEYECADALTMPADDANFDLAWSQHVAMNISDRPRLYSEIRRMLRPGGRFALYDVVAGTKGPVIFPVPWARGPEASFLITEAATRQLLAKTGFRVLSWRDSTAAATAWFQQQQVRAAAAASSSRLGLHLVMGPDFPTMAANLGRNLREGRAGVIQAVVERI